MKFWLKDGALTKYESHLTGSVAFAADQDAQEMEIIRTVEIKDVGKTKVEVPADAKKQLESK
jgi:1,6-anhydro-N-acetylmuramate kinase